VTTAIAVPKTLMVCGRPIRFRTPQMIVWGAVAAVLGSGFIAGLYFGVFQVRWTIAGYQLFYLKPWFDNGLGGAFKSASWVLYRHGERDLLEPAFATMGVKTLMAKPKWRRVRVPAWRLAATPPLLMALAIGLAAGGVWLLDFGLPDAWHAGFGAYRVTAPSFISHSSWQVIVLGIAIGFVLHRLWAPVGATIQGSIIERSVERKAPNPPLWVREPLNAPVMRERWCFRAATLAAGHKLPTTGKSQRWVIAVILVVGVLVTLLGLLAQHWIGLGHSVPYLAP
jgi:hypothetical protein